MHHIISDGVSVNILIREFGELYNNRILPALHIQYKDYAVWQEGFKRRCVPDAGGVLAEATRGRAAGAGSPG